MIGAWHYSITHTFFLAMPQKIAVSETDSISQEQIGLLNSNLAQRMYFIGLWLFILLLFAHGVGRVVGRFEQLDNSSCLIRSIRGKCR